MRHILFIIALLTAALPQLCVHAQKPKDIRAGVTAGVNISHLSKGKQENYIGAHVGIKGEAGLPSVAKGLYLDFGLQFTMKGGVNRITLERNGHKYTHEIPTGDYRLYYMEIPVRVGYRFNLTKRLNLLVTAGPYVSLGIVGKQRVTFTSDQLTEITPEMLNSIAGLIEDYYLYDNVDPFKNTHTGTRIDLGLGAKVGLEIDNHFQILGGYDHGLIGFQREAKLKNRNFTVSLAYMF